MITLKFAPQCKLRDIKSFELETFEDFFKFYIEHNPKGIIFDVKNDGLTK